MKLGQTPDAIEAMPAHWYERAVIAMSAEAEAETIIAKREAEKAKQARG